MILAALNIIVQVESTSFDDGYAKTRGDHEYSQVDDKIPPSHEPQSEEQTEAAVTMTISSSSAPCPQSPPSGSLAALATAPEPTRVLHVDDGEKQTEGMMLLKSATPTTHKGIRMPMQTSACKREIESGQKIGKQHILLCTGDGIHRYQH